RGQNPITEPFSCRDRATCGNAGLGFMVEINLMMTENVKRNGEICNGALDRWFTQPEDKDRMRPCKTNLRHSTALQWANDTPPGITCGCSDICHPQVLVYSRTQKKARNICKSFASVAGHFRESLVLQFTFMINITS
ncbi:hypothetical protein BaRGS_00021400, partial [Batillaria attramentaria]